MLAEAPTDEGAPLDVLVVKSGLDAPNPQFATSPMLVTGAAERIFCELSVPAPVATVYPDCKYTVLFIVEVVTGKLVVLDATITIPELFPAKP